MENAKLKSNSGQTLDAKEEAGSAIRISKMHREIIKSGRAEINKDPTYKKKISITRYIEKLIEDHWQKSIEELKKEREGSKDWLELEYRREAPNMSFFDWLRLRVEGNSKKSSKRKNSGSEK